MCVFDHFFETCHLIPIDIYDLNKICQKRCQKQETLRLCYLEFDKMVRGVKKLGLYGPFDIVYIYEVHKKMDLIFSFFLFLATSRSSNP